LSNIDPSFKRIFETEFPEEPVNIGSSFRRFLEAVKKKNISLIYRIVRGCMAMYSGKPNWTVNQMEQDTNNAYDEAKNKFEFSMAIDELLASERSRLVQRSPKLMAGYIVFRRDFQGQDPNW